MSLDRSSTALDLFTCTSFDVLMATTSFYALQSTMRFHLMLVIGLKMDRVDCVLTCRGVKKSLYALQFTLQYQIELVKALKVDKPH